jgi:hypothetical protein
MTRDEADKELGRIVREALERSLVVGNDVEIDIALDIPSLVSGLPPESLLARIRVGQIR